MKDSTLNIQKDVSEVLPQIAFISSGILHCSGDFQCTLLCFLSEKIVDRPSHHPTAEQVPSLKTPVDVFRVSALRCVLAASYAKKAR